MKLSLSLDCTDKGMASSIMVVHRVPSFPLCQMLPARGPFTNKCTMNVAVKWSQMVSLSCPDIRGQDRFPATAAAFLMDAKSKKRCVF